jgi:hypothetical protein
MKTPQLDLLRQEKNDKSRLRLVNTNLNIQMEKFVFSQRNKEKLTRISQVIQEIA